MDEAAQTRVAAIGVARPYDPVLRPLPFASADARNFAEGLRPVGTVEALIDAQATEGSIRGLCRGLANGQPSDFVILFAIAHATRSDGDVLLAVHDGPVSLHEMLRPIWDGPARRVVLLFDLHRGGIGEDRPAAAELAALFPPRPGRALLLADDGRHGSHVSGELQAGIWAAHVTAAFSGEAARARDADGRLTVGSLRAFLADEVSRSLARAYTDGRRQSPVLVAFSEEEVLAGPIATPEGAARPPLAGVRFFTDRELPVKLLGGFRKSLHSPPADTLASSREWVARLAEPDLAKEVEETVVRLRRCLGYKRRDIRADGPAAGAASVLTPDFAYHVTARQHPSKPDRVVFRRTLDEVRNVEVLGRPALGDAFPQGFLSLHHPFEAAADVEALIDALEDSEPPGLKRLDYPTDLAYCDLELAGFDGRVRIERDGLTVTAAGPTSPAELARQYALVKRLLHVEN